MSFFPWLFRGFSALAEAEWSVSIWKTERKAEVFNHSLEPALRQGLASFQEWCTRQPLFFLKFRRSSMLGNVLQRAKMLPTCLLAVPYPKQSRCYWVQPAFVLVKAWPCTPLPSTPQVTYPARTSASWVCWILPNTGGNIWSWKRQLWKFQITTLPLSYICKIQGIRFIEIRCSYFTSKDSEELQDSAMNEMNTMYCIQFVYFDFITNGYY